MTDRRLTINAPQVVHETIDGETILIHLGTGVYYSLDGVGAQVWGLLATGAGEREVLADAQARYDADPQIVGHALGSFVGQLLDEGLLVQTPPDSVPTVQRLDAAESSTPAPFVAPVLGKYTDMQEFMLVDPLHDVEEEAGWPHVKAG
jgi:coenzyme PQQ synthesis protein D (PqqD)